jgi:mercuric ion transport protein
LREHQSMAAIATEAPRAPTNVDRGAATLGTVASIGALFSAAACCILPLALAALGLGATGLAAVVPFHWPLTVAAMAAVAAGWLFHVRKRRACSRDASCTTAPPARSTLALLCVATAFVTVSALWSFIEAPLMRALGGQ